MLAPLVCARFRLILQAADRILLNDFAGATLRGGFGHVFKKTVCVWPPGDCSRCLLKHTCSYPYIFETAPPPGAAKLRNLDQVPRPFVIEPPTGQHTYEPGERFEFRLLLIGRGIEYLPYFVFTFQRLGEQGLGRELGRFRLLEVHSETATGSHSIFDDTTGVLDTRIERTTFNNLPPLLGSRLSVHFLTPTRIRKDASMQTELTFQDLIRALLRRLSSLMYFHCGHELEVDFRSLIDQASIVTTVRSQLRWHDQTRFSGRQRQNIEMGGVVGEVEYEAPSAEFLQAYWPLLKAGEWVHVGKGCVMGLGKIRCSA